MKIRAFLYLAVLGSIACLPVRAQVYTGTWTGGGVDSNWSTGDNWGGTAPTASGTTSITLSGAVGLTPNTGAGDYTLSSLVFNSSAGSFSLSGGMLVLNGANHYSATVNNLSASNQTISNNITLGASSGIVISAGGGNMSITGNINNNGKALGLNNISPGTVLSVSGVISGAGLLGFELPYTANSGMISVSGMNTYYGDTVNWGSTVLVGQNVISGQNGAFGRSWNAISMGIDGQGTVIPKILTNGSYTIGRDVQIVSVTGTNKVKATIGGYTADVSTFSGSVIMGSANGAAQALTVSAATGGLVNVTGNLQRNATGATGSADAVTKVGAGIVALKGANNNYSGTTLVSAGTLLINGTLTSGGGAVTVGDSTTPATLATLGGVGTINRNVGVLANGILSAGDMNISGVSSAGTLTIGGNLALANASILNFDLGSLSDQIIVNGNLTLDGILNVTAGAGFGVGTYTLLSYSGSLTDSTLVLGNLPVGYTYSVDTISTPGLVNLNVVPEPQSWALLLTASLVFSVALRRKNS